ncbi:hypothetical protein Cgig2_026285 [Carnegiea gigantea]|uniref:DUF4283 domain-containing protein n=1 Tax=Carnegiea gigantea TaxID=171969 RepID=A0A9Q1JQP6_9CARY|nr:hypothetical protein Cgig2_026285 [Carnegiea gigantea]
MLAKSGAQPWYGEDEVDLARSQAHSLLSTQIRNPLINSRFRLLPLTKPLNLKTRFHQFPLTNSGKPDEGTSLFFIAAPIINGKKCPELEPEDVASEVDHWQSAVLCMVLGANPPLEVIDGFIRRIWGNYWIDKVSLVRPGLFLVRFDRIHEQQEVINKGVFYFNRKPFIVKP